MNHNGNHRVDELMELLWTLQEEGLLSADEVVERSDDSDPRSLLDQIMEDGLVKLGDQEELLLTPKGQKRAQLVIRRHRLAERLLVDLFDLGDEQKMESSACAFEHVLSDDVIDRVCGFLGHPPLCPHGKTIPPGECCATYGSQIQPLVSRLSALEPGATGKISFMAPNSRASIGRLASLGVVPGATAKIVQRKPAFVVKVDETLVAIDPDIASDIYIRHTDSAETPQKPKSLKNRLSFSRSGRFRWGRNRTD